MTDFEGVLPALNQALANRGYESLTPVQQAVIAPDLAGKDTLVSAQTGSGKTVAFGLAMAPDLLLGEDRFGRADVPMGLIIAPTRELALQVMRELEWLYRETGAQLASCVGGMDMGGERRALKRGAHIVVGTPGRLRDHIERGSLDVTFLRAVVLDEADEMLDMGFRDDLEYILDTTPPDRRTLLFSATVPKSIAALARRYQQDAVRVSTKAEKEQHSDIEYRALSVAPNDKENAIINLLRYYEPTNSIVFCGTRATVNHLTSRLNNRGFSVVALSGELSQKERINALQAMRDCRAQVCVATDVAARGIDLPKLELVIHADIPKSPEPLLHRSGRTGRAGRKGVSALVVPYNWRKRTERLLQAAKVQANWGKPPSVEEIAQRDRERFLASPALAEPISDEEMTAVRELLDSHSPEQVAAALIRQHQSKRPAPEELLDQGPAGRPDQDRGERGERKQRGKSQDFEDGVWFQLSVGRKHNAEPRWIIPMLCRNGHVTKNGIGAIRINQDNTHVELSPHVVDQFLEAIGPSRKIEKTVTVDRLEGVPEDKRERRGPPSRDRDSRDRGPRDRAPRDRGSKDRAPREGGFQDRGPRDGGRPDDKSRDRRDGKPARFEDNKRSERTEKPRREAPRKQEPAAEQAPAAPSDDLIGSDRLWEKPRSKKEFREKKREAFAKGSKAPKGKKGPDGKKQRWDKGKKDQRTKAARAAKGKSGNLSGMATLKRKGPKSDA
ncbi:DEAD/DEAH box helicase [Aestuariispira insulae]|uniref:ATP-dependent RNA helicase DeaD n=1 Tax=Aestuariispira insulae TaxID=1461337 RepID=A0A3D9HTK1_9PROT|nr:DEAD/DEAH box helicase [Aestuariispira insulae]RED52206.1 ATP-dependent RNA helicase DeaD [Aestuariispira insulae]